MTDHHRMPSPCARLAGAALVALALGATALPQPAHAFWGLLGKAASGAGKAAGGTAGKAAGAAGAAGVAGEAATAAGAAGKAGAAGAGAATLADDAARASGKAAGSADAAGGAAHGFSAVNAALPPEVAVYLAKPAASLTGADTAAMMGLYERLVAQAGKTGDFSVLERMPQVHGAKALPQPAAPVPVPVKAGVAVQQPSPATAPPSPSAAAEMGLAGLRLLAHAGTAGHRGAQNELRQRCADPAVLRTAPADVQAQCKAALATRPGAAAKPRPSAS